MPSKSSATLQQKAAKHATKKKASSITAAVKTKNIKKAVKAPATTTANKVRRFKAGTFDSANIAEIFKVGPLDKTQFGKIISTNWDVKSKKKN